MKLDHISVNAQSSICIRGSKVLCFDPFQVKEESNDADVILVSHEHFDHFEPDSIAKVISDTSVIVAPASMKDKLLVDLDIQEERCRLLIPGDELAIDGVNIIAVPAYNNAKPFHPKANGWLGYIVVMDGVRYYIAGDTEVTEDNRNISCDVALIPIGGTYTMDRDQAAQYVLNINPVAAIPTHYGAVVGNADDGEVFKKNVEKNSDIQVELRL